MSNVTHMGSADSDLVTTAQAAELTGKSVATINRWADAGALPTAYKAPGLRGPRLFRRDDVAAMTRQAAS